MSDFTFDVHNAQITNGAILAERMRAHAIHGLDSMEDKPWRDAAFLPVLVEEVGEVARVLCDLRHGRLTEEDARLQACKELIQVAAMAAIWSEACDRA